MCCVVVAHPPLILERCVGLREGLEVERRCAMMFPLFLCQLIPTALAHLAPWSLGSNLAVCVWTEQLMTGQRIQQICYQWFKQQLILSVSKPSISQWSQIKEDPVKPSVPAREFNLEAYAAITWHNDGPQTQTLRSPWSGSVYRDATNSATAAGLAGLFVVLICILTRKRLS